MAARRAAIASQYPAEEHTEDKAKGFPPQLKVP